MQPVYPIGNLSQIPQGISGDEGGPSARLGQLYQILGLPGAR